MLFLMTTSCGVFKKSSKTDKVKNTSSLENFDSFYDRFHSDPEFQLERIEFPLGGVKIDGMEESAWSKANWNIMKVKIYDIDQSQFIVKYQKNEDSFTQSFKMKNAEFYADYRFKRIEGKWYLVYAKDVNL